MNNEIISYGAIGAVILFILTIINWRRSSNKPTVQSKKEYKESKQAVSNVVSNNDKQIDNFIEVVNDADNATDNTINDINQIIDSVNVQTRQDQLETDPKQTVNNILRKWE